MLDVFISYFFRRDIDFVRHLFGQLTACDRDPRANWQDIFPTTDWLVKACRGIESTESLPVCD